MDRSASNSVRSSRLLVSFCVTIALLTVLIGVGVSTLNVQAAIYNRSSTSAANWTSAIWSCSTQGAGDVCATYPGQITTPFGNTAQLGGTSTVTVNTAIPNPVTLNTQNGLGVTLDVASGGVLTLTGGSAVTGTSGSNTMAINGGTVTNNGTLSVNGIFGTQQLLFNGGTLNGTGSTSIGAGGTGGVFNISGTQGPMTINQAVSNAATTNYTSSANTLTLGGGQTFTNTGTGTFNANGTASILQGAGGALFANAGNFSRTLGGSLTVAVPFDNTQQVNLNGSALLLSFTGGSTTAGHTGTFNLGLGGTLSFGGSHYFTSFATPSMFSGSGTINVLSGGTFTVQTTPTTMLLPSLINLSNAGLIDLTQGTSTEFRGINLAGGNYNQAASGNLKVKIGPPGGPTGPSSLLNVNGSSTLAGALTAILGPGYTPVPGDGFTVFTTNTRTGDFSPKNLPPFAGGSFVATYVGSAPESLRLLAVAPSADLSIAKSGAPNPVNAGGTLTYSLSVSNAGPDPAASVSVTDTLPVGTTFLSAAGTGWTCTGTSTVNCTTPSLAAATTAPPITITVTAPNSGGTLNNTASVGSGTSDPNGTNNTSNTVTTAVTPIADLMISKASSSPLTAGSNTTYTITVTNNGPSDATGVTVSDATPPQTTFVSNSGACTTPFPCSLGTLTSGSSATITSTYLLAPTANGNIANTASVSASTSDPNNTNNSSTVNGTVGASADIQITKGGPGTANPGQTITFNILVRNNGPSAATGVTVNDPTPAGLTLVSVSSGTCSSFPCAIGSLGLGGSAGISATYTVSSSATGTITNVASVTSTTTDPNSANDSASAVVAINPSSDLSITKTGPATAAAGQTITYTVTVTNNGPSTSSASPVTDPTPTGLTFNSNSGACTAPYPCTIPALAPGASATILSTYTVSNTPPPTITNNAKVTSTTFDPNLSNDTASATTNTSPSSADLQITKVGPSTLPPGGGAITFNITVKNNGPGTATNLIVNDSPSAGLVFVSNSGACTTPFPCSIASLAPAASATIQSTFTVGAGVKSVSNTADVFASSSDPNSSNNVSTVIVGQSCPNGTITQFTPSPGQQDAPVSGPLQWSGVGATSYDVYLGPAGGGCSTLVATVNGTTYNYSGLSPNTDYESRIVARKPGCPAITSSCVRWRTGAGACNLAAPQLQQPASGATVGSPATLRWSAVGGSDVSYRVVVSSNGTPVVDVTTKDTFLEVTLPNGTASWTVTAFQGGCQSPPSTGQFNVCAPPEAPLAGVVGAPSSGNTYSVLVVNPSANNVRYEFQEATNDSFNNATTQTTSTPSVAYTHSATSAQVFFYRVRAFAACTNTPGPYSKTVRVVILPPVVNTRNPSLNVPFGTKNLVVVQVQIPGESTPVNFTATADRPWIVKIEPDHGLLPTQGIAVNVTMDPAQLPNGTFTATLIVTTSSLTGGNSRLVGNASGKSIPVTLNLVTPVVPNNPSGPTENSLIIPAVGHLAGINSQWRSDIRIYNASPQTLQYLLNYKPQGSFEVKQTTITTASGDTTALDDIIHNWYGVGEVGDSETGVLEIRPMTTDGSTKPPAGGSFLTVASSRTFNATSDGTVGQFIPPVKFTNFIGAGSRLSMQQLAQSSAYRTNFGIVEASGAPVSLILSMFNDAGSKLFDLPVNLNGGEQKLLNGLLAQQGVTINDGRMEVKVQSGDGKITAYASVIDNASLDPQLVPGQNLTNATAKLYVVPGVADLNNAVASWRTDMRIYNAGSTPQTTELVFYPQDKSGAPIFATLTVNPNEVKAIDSVLQSLFSTHDIGGMVQLTTPNDSALVVTGRTYNQTGAGTLGQFIKAATAADGATSGGRALNILQVEDSPRFRTNLGLAEMTGKPATVEISLILPDSKITPSIQVPLAANEFRQFGVAQFGVGNVYNARLSVKVIDGAGSVTAYGSVIDQVTTDPTFVQAQ